MPLNLQQPTAKAGPPGPPGPPGRVPAWWLPVAVAGNVGTAASSLVGEVSPEATVVCEASSFQLEDTIAFAPEAALLLNLAPDHLDRHPSYEDYVAAKLRIFANQGNYDLAVIPEELQIDVKQLGVISPGGGHRVHGRQARPGRKRGLGYDYLHVAIDAYSRVAYLERLPNQTGTSCAGFASRRGSPGVSTGPKPSTTHRRMIASFPAPASCGNVRRGWCRNIARAAR